MQNRPPPAWPADSYASINELSEYVQWQIGTLAIEDSEAFWRNHLALERRLTLEEQALMKADFEERPKRWSRISAHLGSGSGSPRFLELVASLIANGGFVSKATLDDYQTAAELAQAIGFYDAIGTVLRRSYPKVAAEDKSQKIEKMTARLCQALWDYVPKRTDSTARFSTPAKDFAQTRKRLRDSRDMALRAVTHAVYFGPTK